jgi:hypothetical protein
MMANAATPQDKARKLRPAGVKDGATGEGPQGGSARCARTGASNACQDPPACADRQVRVSGQFGPGKPLGD